MPVTRKADKRHMDRAPGVVVNILTDGDRAMLCEVLLEPGSVVPSHTHVHEQTGTLISGRMQFDIGDETFDLHPGDSWMIPSNLPHEARAVDQCVVVEVFSPPREDWR